MESLRYFRLRQQLYDMSSEPIDLLGDTTLIGPGVGRIKTGYAIIGDILSFRRQS